MPNHCLCLSQYRTRLGLRNRSGNRIGTRGSNNGGNRVGTRVGARNHPGIDSNNENSQVIRSAADIESGQFVGNVADIEPIENIIGQNDLNSDHFSMDCS